MCTRHFSISIQQSVINICSLDFFLLQISLQVAGKEKEIQGKELICILMSRLTHQMWSMWLMLIYWPLIPCRCASEVNLVSYITSFE